MKRHIPPSIPPLWHSNLHIVPVHSSYLLTYVPTVQCTYVCLYSGGMKLFCTEKKMFSIRFSQVNLACFPYPGTYIVFCRYIPPQQKSGRKSARKSFDGKSFPLALCFDFCGKVYPHKLLFFCSVRPSGSRNPLQTLDNGYLEKLFLPANPGL